MFYQIAGFVSFLGLSVLLTIAAYACGQCVMADVYERPLHEVPFFQKTWIWYILIMCAIVAFGSLAPTDAEDALVSYGNWTVAIMVFCLFISLYRGWSEGLKWKMRHPKQLYRN